MTVGPGDALFAQDGTTGDATAPEPAAPIDAGPTPAIPPQRRSPVPPGRTAPLAGPPARPRIVEDPGILGLSRRSRSRVGSLLFTWFFVLVFTLIVVQMVASLLDPW
jgi:hypothetical protein